MSVVAVDTVIRESHARCGARMVALAIATHVNERRGDGYAWPSVRRLAQETSLTKRQVYRCLAELVRLGELEVHKARRGRVLFNVYRLVVGGLRSLSDTPPFDLVRAGAKRVRGEAESSSHLDRRGDISDTPYARASDQVLPEPEGKAPPRGLSSPSSRISQTRGRPLAISPAEIARALGRRGGDEVKSKDAEESPESVDDPNHVRTPDWEQRRDPRVLEALQEISASLVREREGPELDAEDEDDKEQLRLAIQANEASRLRHIRMVAEIKEAAKPKPRGLAKVRAFFSRPA